MQNQPELIPPFVKNQSPKKRSGLLGVSLALLLAIGSFLTGFQINELVNNENQQASIFSLFASEKKPAAKNEANLDEFWRVWNLLDQKFATASSTHIVSVEDRINGAIQGMVRAHGDPYTVFLPPVESAEFAQDISGNFSGIGMEVGIRNGLITIISPLPDTPAAKAGLLSGDIITKIDGFSTESMSIDNAVRRIRGEKGTSVVLSIYREGELEIREFTITRDTITIPTVKYEKKGDTFVIRIFSFNAIAEMKTQEALREFTRSGAKSLIIDLRGNPGGYLQSAISISGFFLPTGKIVLRENFGEGNEEKLYRSQGRTFYDFNPKNLVVLVDNGSASASEILAGALKEHNIATVIGINTFGKGSVQELVNLPSGSALKVTVARWFSPNGTSISNGGLEPNIIIKRTPEQRMEDVDPQLEAALQFLSGKEIVSEKVD